MMTLFNAKNLRPYIDNPQYNYSVIFLFIWLLTYGYTWTSLLFSITVILSTMYIYSVSSMSGNLFMRVTEQFFMYFVLAWMIVSYTIPLVNLLLELWLPLCYFFSTIIIMQYVPKYIYLKYNEINAMNQIKPNVGLNYKPYVKTNNTSSTDTDNSSSDNSSGDNSSTDNSSGDNSSADNSSANEMPDNKVVNENNNNEKKDSEENTVVVQTQLVPNINITLSNIINT